MSESDTDRPNGRWRRFFCKAPRYFHEYLITADLTNIWRSHLVWAKRSGHDLKTCVEARYTSMIVYMSLLVSSEMAIVYSPSKPADAVRLALENEQVDQLEYWLGVSLCVAIFFSVAALISSFTAWSIFSSLSKENAPVILRSSIGMYAAQLPSRLTTFAIYIFFAVVVLTWWVLMHSKSANILTMLGIFLISHIVNTFSSIGRVVMHTGAMGEEYIFDVDEEEKLSPAGLSDRLLVKTSLAKKAKIPVNRQYSIKYHDMLRDLEAGQLQFPVSLDRVEGLRNSGIEEKKVEVERPYYESSVSSTSTWSM